jgi:Regulator of ribonuclease activity B
MATGDGGLQLMASDRDALEELFRNSLPGVRHVLVHYLYFPREASAKAAVQALGEAGYATEDRLGADGVNWLVLARHEAIPSEQLLARARQEMEQTARRGQGEYDGWEAEVRDSDGTAPRRSEQ